MLLMDDAEMPSNHEAALALEGLLAFKQAGKEQLRETTEQPLTTKLDWSAAPAEDVSTATSSTGSPPPVSHDDTDMETEEDEAACILSSVLCSKPSRPPLAPYRPSREYEDLLDCLASVASRRAPLEPLDRKVLRLSMTDDVHSPPRPGANGKAATGSCAEDEEDDAEDLAELRGRRRPRAMSNPEGCDTWRTYEMGARPSAAAAIQLSEKTLRMKEAVHASTTASSSSTSGAPMLPQMVAKYADVYNKNGRIGIYTREERDAIIARFHEKRLRRVWKKTIRYSCRKNLADKRVRYKGRFVRLPPKSEELTGGRADPMEEDVKAGPARSEEGDDGEDAEEQQHHVPQRRMRRHSFA